MSFKKVIVQREKAVKKKTIKNKVVKRKITKKNRKTLKNKKWIKL